MSCLSGGEDDDEKLRNSAGDESFGNGGCYSNSNKENSTSHNSNGTGIDEHKLMATELNNVKAEFDFLTPMADSTMKDNALTTTDSPDSLELHCCVERVRMNALCSSTEHKNIRHDSKVNVPSQTAFCDLVQTVLQNLGYSDVDLLGARGMIVIKNWKPMTIDAITDDPWAKVGDILGGLSTLITLQIYLCNSFKYRILEDVKEKLLSFLLRNSHDLLQASGCPLKQTVLEEIFKDKSSFSDDLRRSFNEWYCDQITHKKTTLKTNERNVLRNGQTAEITNGEENLEEDHEGRVVLTGNTMSCKAQAHGRLWIDHEGDWFKLRNRRKHGLLRRMPRHSFTPKEKQVFGHEDIFPSFQEYGSAVPMESVSNDSTEPTLDTAFPSAIAKELRQKTEKRKDLDAASGNTEEEVVKVPELPNKNAVYVIQPLPISNSGSERVEVILSSSETESEECEYNGVPQDLSKTVVSSSATNENTQQDKNPLHVSQPRTFGIGGMDFPTNLSLRDGPKSLAENSEQNRNLLQIVGTNPLETNAKYISPTKIRRREYDDDDDDDEFDNDNDEDTDADSSYSYKRKHSLKLSQNMPSTFGIPSQIQMSKHQQEQQRQQCAASHLLAMSNTINFMHRLHSTTLPIRQPFQEYLRSSLLENMNSDNDHKKRSRVFIDPISETPKLEQWFTIESHPSTASIEEFTNELNQSLYRQRFPKLEPKNVQLWFKNHRAKVKRLKVEGTLEKN